MSVLNALFNGNNLDNIQEAFNDTDTTSAEMQRNINECYELFYAGNSDLEDNCQKIPVCIIDRLVKTAFSEYKATGSNDKINDLLKKINKIKKPAMQSVLLGGESFIKPVINAGDINFHIISRNCFIPLGRYADGTINKVGMTETTVVNNSYYTLVETRTAGDVLTIEYSLYVSNQKGSLGRRVPLGTLSKYADLEETATIPLAWSLGMAQIKTPILNCVDGSNDGVCIFSAAVPLIKNINRNERQFDDEFDLSQKRIFASEDLFYTTDSEGNRHPIMKDKVFMALDGFPDEVGIKEFSPEIREQSYLNRKNEYLRNIENICGFKRGLLSNVEEQQRTAKEITDSEGSYNLTIIDLQDMWTEGIQELIDICASLSRIYNAGYNDIKSEDIVFDYGDGVLYNRDKTFNELLSLVGSGVLDARHLIGWYYEIDTTTPEGLKKAEAMMPEMERLLNDAE